MAKDESDGSELVTGLLICGAVLVGTRIIVGALSDSQPEPVPPVVVAPPEPEPEYCKGCGAQGFVRFCGHGYNCFCGYHCDNCGACGYSGLCGACD